MKKKKKSLRKESNLIKAQNSEQPKHKSDRQCQNKSMTRSEQERNNHQSTNYFEQRLEKVDSTETKQQILACILKRYSTSGTQSKKHDTAVHNDIVKQKG